MRKIALAIICTLGLVACDKHDPILSGTRVAIFDTHEIKVTNQDVADLPDTAMIVNNDNCSYTQDASNTIWDGERKIFSGFPTSNFVKSTQKPVCSGKYVYAGLTTGELVKINPRNRQIVWIADIYRTSNLTGGASMVDIIAPIVPIDKYVYVGSLGDAFCKINAENGSKKWCINLGVSVGFVLVGDFAFVVGTDNNLYAINTEQGQVYWRAPVQEIHEPTYEKGKIFVGKQQFSAKNGKKLK